MKGGCYGEKVPRAWDHGRLSWDTCSRRGPSTSCQAFQRRVVQVQTSQDSQKFWVEGYGGEKSAVRPSSSCEPKKSVASSVSVVERPSSDGSERHRSRSGDRKRRSHGYDRHQNSPKHHAYRHDSGRWEGERSEHTSLGGSSSRRQADSTGGSGSSRVSKAMNAQPSASSSHAHHHRKSSGDRRSLSSSLSRASTDRKSPPGHHHDRRRESAERSGSSYVSRREVQFSLGRYPVTREENHNSDPFAGPARSRRKTCSWSGRLSNSDGSIRGCGRASRWRPGKWRPRKWRPSRWWPSIWWVGRPRVRKTWRASCDRWSRGSCRPSKPAVSSNGRPSTPVWRPGRCGRPSTPSALGIGRLSSPWNSSREYAIGRTRLIHLDRCQQSSFPVNANNYQPGYVDWFYVHVDFAAAMDGPGYGCFRCPGQASCTVNCSCSQWWHLTQEVWHST